jgi:uncharacterized protein (TIGR03067 family)
MASAKVVPKGTGKHYKPSASEDIYFLVTGTDTDGDFDHFELFVGYLDGFPLHIHLEQHETFHVIEGELRLQIGDEIVDAKAGDFCFIPKGIKHTYVNLKKEPARAIGILTPGGFDKFVDEMIRYTSTLSGPPDPKKMDEIGARHQQKQMGPPLAVSMGLKGNPKAAAKQRDLEHLQGDWLVTHREMSGQAVTAEELKQNETHLLIDGNKASLQVNHHAIADGLIINDPSVTPKAFDLTWIRFDPMPDHRGKTTLAIYDLSGDRLKVCMSSLDGTYDRPTNFESRPESKSALVVYERQQK